MSDHPHQSKRREERGIVVVIAALAMVALVLFGALAIDVGAVWSTRTQSQNTADAAALAAAEAIEQGTSQVTVDQVRAAARAAAIDIAAANSTLANPSMTLRDSDEDVAVGRWNPAKRTFSTVGLGNPGEVTGVRVNLVMDGTVNQRSPSFLSGLLGRQGFDVRSTATAFLGFQGAWDAGDFDLPIAIDSCNITDNDADDDGCGDAFCATVEDDPPPTPCDLSDDSGEVSCLKFPSAGGSGRNACWTGFKPSGIVEADLLDMVEDGSPSAARVGDTVDLAQILIDDGDVRLIEDIGRRFYGEAPYNDPDEKEGEDRHAPFDGNADSWVVKLPVVECQNNHHCEFPGKITGAVCFEIREVEFHGETKKIKGTFLCPSSSDEVRRQLYAAHCRADDGDRGTGPGGCNFGMRADRAVLVQ
jgi:Flp pilus assembly protein TadG